MCVLVMNADKWHEHGYMEEWGEILKGKKIKEEILQDILSPFKIVSFFKKHEYLCPIRSTRTAAIKCSGETNVVRPQNLSFKHEWERWIPTARNTHCFVAGNITENHSRVFTKKKVLFTKTKIVKVKRWHGSDLVISWKLIYNMNHSHSVSQHCYLCLLLKPSETKQFFNDHSLHKP